MNSNAEFVCYKFTDSQLLLDDSILIVTYPSVGPCSSSAVVTAVVNSTNSVYHFRRHRAIKCPRLIRLYEYYLNKIISDIVAGVGTCPMGRTPPWQVDSPLRSRLADLSLHQSHNTSFAPKSGLFAVHLACIRYG
jgi:hypothetical protein